MNIDINYTTGYAGTGKSTELLALLSTLDDETTVCLAPTHKALGRLRSEYEGEIELKTLHSLLGVIPTINEEATHINNINSTYKLDKELYNYTNIVIDEAGMISEEMFLDLITKMENLEPQTNSCTFHLFMDQYQLLPVKGQQIMTDPDTTKNLTVQHRSESPDVVALYTKYVHYLEGTNSDDLTTPYSNNIKPFDLTKFVRGDRILAYTNKAVGEYNQQVAKMHNITSYEGQEVQLGSEGTFKCTKFLRPNILQLMKAWESKQLRLQNSNISKDWVEHSLKQLIDCKDIHFVEVNSQIVPVILGIGNAAEIIKSAGKAAIKDRKKFAQVYNLGRCFTMDYTYASTVHKAQGQEFHTVFVDKPDLKKSIRNNWYETYARLMYVSISRAKNTIYI